MNSARKSNWRVFRLGGVMAGGLLALAIMAGEASAQYFGRPFGYGGYYGGAVVLPPIPRRPVGMHPADIFEELEARGYRGLSLSGRRSDVFVIDAISPRNQPVRLVVDRYDGEILERFARKTDTAGRPEADPFGAVPETRRKEADKGAKKSDRVAELPEPPRRPADAATPEAPAVGAPVARRPAPVAPARDPSLWAPAVPKS